MRSGSSSPCICLSKRWRMTTPRAIHGRSSRSTGSSGSSWISRQCRQAGRATDRGVDVESLNADDLVIQKPLLWAQQAHVICLRTSSHRCSSKTLMQTPSRGLVSGGGSTMSAMRPRNIGSGRRNGSRGCSDAKLRAARASVQRTAAPTTRPCIRRSRRGVRGARERRASVPAALIAIRRSDRFLACPRISDARRAVARPSRRRACVVLSQESEQVQQPRQGGTQSESDSEARVAGGL